MPISKFDIYNQEWIEFVFEKRNKSYGAYELRKHYASTMVKAITITLAIISGIFIAALLLSDHHVKAATTRFRVSEVDLSKKFIVVYPEKSPLNTHAAVKSVSHKFVVNKNNASVSHSKSSLKYINNIIVDANSGRPAQPNVTIDEKPVDDPTDIHGLDVLPAPACGTEGWVTFLQKNIQYPAYAKLNKVSGKVWLSFIIEKDGRISNIKVERPAGNGFDEEAVRVLNLAPAWTPGFKNGQNARVKYTMPINFHIDR